MYMSDSLLQFLLFIQQNLRFTDTVNYGAFFYYRGLCTL